MGLIPISGTDVRAFQSSVGRLESRQPWFAERGTHLNTFWSVACAWKVWLIARLGVAQEQSWIGRSTASFWSVYETHTQTSDSGLAMLPVY